MVDPVAHEIKTHETPTLQWSLGRDITGATVALYVANHEPPFTVALNGVAATVVTAATGLISYTFAANTLPVGSYDVEVRTTTAGVVLAFPSVGFGTIRVMQGLG